MSPHETGSNPGLTAQSSEEQVIPKTLICKTRPKRVGTSKNHRCCAKQPESDWKGFTYDFFMLSEYWSWVLKRARGAGREKSEKGLAPIENAAVSVHKTLWVRQGATIDTGGSNELRWLVDVQKLSGVGELKNFFKAGGEGVDTSWVSGAWAKRLEKRPSSTRRLASLPDATEDKEI